MTPRIVLSIRDLTGKGQAKLTEVLQIRPQEDALQYTNRVSTEIEHLPLYLKNPKALIEMLASGYEPAPLCKFHKDLNARLIRSIFDAVAVEIGLRCNSFMSYDSDLMAKHLDAIVALRRTHSMWLDRETFRRTFQVEPAHEWPYQRDQCEACMLSRIGGNLEVLATLRSVLLSRTRTRSATPQRPGIPRLLRFVEQWIASHGQPGQERLAQSDRVGADLKVVRKSIWRMRRRDRERRAVVERQASGENTNRANTMDDELDHSDPENELIDHCTALVSTPHLPLLPRTKEIDHMAQTNFDDEQLRQTSNDQAYPSDEKQQTEQKVRPESRRSSVQTYMPPRNHWVQRPNPPIPNQSQRQTSAPPTGQLYANSDVSGSWMSVNSAYTDGNRNITPMSSSAYLQPRQIWEDMREQTMRRPDTTSRYGEDKANPRDSTISLPYVAPQNPGRYDVPDNANREANTNAQSYQDLLAPQPLFSAERLATPAQETDPPPHAHPLNSDRAYAEASEQMHRARKDLLATLNEFYPGSAPTASVAIFSTTGLVSPKTVTPTRQDALLVSVPPEKVDDKSPFKPG